ncbi:hypothetical protein FB451DRAFT_1371191 [Mycena latifolia]|nr:hypothetical protein FB451DRAFT_1371191 [Mycena latifolia]
MPPKAKPAPAAAAEKPPRKARKSRAKPKPADDPPPPAPPPPAPEIIDDSDDDSSVEVTGKKRMIVNWIQNPHWTAKIITYLFEHPEFRIRLFSDSTAEAKEAGRAKLVGKDGKPQQYGVLAKHVFKDDPKEQARYANNAAKYATAVDTRLRRLKKEYKKWVVLLGATGAGLHPDQVIPGSNIANLLDEIRSKWPWWDDLHPFWSELPNYNPVGVQSSEPGVDHAGDALSLFEPSAGATSEDEDVDDPSSMLGAEDIDLEDDGGDYKSHESDPDEESDDGDLDVRHLSSAISLTLLTCSARRARRRGVHSDHHHPPSPPPPPTLPAPKKTTSKARSKPKAATGGLDLGLAKANSTPSSAAKAKSKKPLTAIDRLNDLRETESARLLRKREMQHEEEMARIKVKKAKYDLKLLKAQTELKLLNKRALTSPSSPRRTRVLNLSARSPARLSQHSHRFSDGPIGYPGSITNSPASSRGATSLFSGLERADRMPGEGTRHLQPGAEDLFTFGGPSTASDEAFGTPPSSSHDPGTGWYNEEAMRSIASCEVPIFRRFGTPLESSRIQVVTL